MKNKLLSGTILMLIIIVSSAGIISGQTSEDVYIINKKGGRIIQAEKLFKKFLDSDKSWQSYKKIVLDKSPEMVAVQNKMIEWGDFDTAAFRKEVTNYKKSDWEKYFNVYSRAQLDFLYDSLIIRANKTLPPVKNIPVDLCFFVPYHGCFIIAGDQRNTIYISLLIDPADVPKIMIHEYAHNLHIQRRPVEPYWFGREVVSEGMAVYLTTLTLPGYGLAKSIPFMPESSVDWCFKNETKIKEAIRPELRDTTFNSMKKFIADGDIATPPAGFVEKTAYFAGYRIVESCIKKGISLENLCSLNADSVIKLSGYFK